MMELIVVDQERSMKLEDTRGYYSKNSTSLSLASRQLAFAGIAVVWIFAIKKGDQVIINHALLLPLSCFVIGLALDLLQYMYASAAWGIYNRTKELQKDISIDTEFKAPKLINWPTLLFFWAKSIFIIFGYYYLLQVFLC